MIKQLCIVCGYRIQSDHWKGGKWQIVEIGATFEDEWENGSVFHQGTRIRLYICPECGAVFTDWDKGNQ